MRLLAGHYRRKLARRGSGTKVSTPSTLIRQAFLDMGDRYATRLGVVFDEAIVGVVSWRCISDWHIRDADRIEFEMLHSLQPYSYDQGRDEMLLQWQSFFPPSFLRF